MDTIEGSESDKTETDQVEEKPDAGNPDEAAKKPVEGTPDKALQKVQQEVGNISRQLAALTEKSNSDGGLSEADKAKVEKAKTRLDKIRAFVSRPDREDIPSDVDPIAEHVLELADKVSKQDESQAELKQLRERLFVLENDRNWSKAKEKYAGLDVEAIWEKAVVDATGILGDAGNPAALNRLASKWFEERCDAAKKRIKDDDGKKNDKPSSPASNYKVGTGQRAAPVLSDEDEALAMARQLVTEI